ncbi:MAG: hypothetical protein EYC70_08650 [Planctomycetota bacterium]|nr:MAG: hypothetical protein EYC70_08650 [Planctomycetota bacterium]
MRILRSWMVPAALAAALLSAPLAAQGAIFTWYGDTAYDGLGRSVAGIGDLNADGRSEVIAGAPLDGFTAQDAGLARVFNGLSGAVVTNKYGTVTLNEFGNWVAGVGDVNGDGVPDYAVGEYRADFAGGGSGSAYIYSGLTHAQLYRKDGAGTKDFLGISIDGVGDLNSDGAAEWIAGAWEYDPGINPGTGKGYARVYDGATGNIVYEVFGDDNEDFFGYDVAGVGDVDGDGKPDFAVGAYGDEMGFGAKTGAVRVFSGATGLALYTITGDSAGDQFGYSVDGLGDVNNDGRPDIVIGANLDLNGAAVKTGSARVVSGATGATLLTRYGDAADDFFGQSVAGLGDISGDGRPDFLVAGRGNDFVGDYGGMVRAFSGANGSTLFTLYGDSANDVFGFSIANAGDLTNDGIDEFIIGASQYNPNNGQGNGNGYARVYDSTIPPPPPPPRWPNLPVVFKSIGSGYSENFDGLAGVPPSHFAINELNALSRTADGQAWCNIGQRGPCTGGNSGVGPNSGLYDLELGNAVGAQVGFRNASGLVIGLNGAGAGTVTLDFNVYDFGEEADTDDGVFVSEDGMTWTPVYAGWMALPDGAWTAVTGVDLSAMVNTSGDFYLLFAQSDTNEIGNGDGILVDDVEVQGSSGGGLNLVGPVPGTAGANNQLAIQNGTPSATVGFAYAFQAGSTNVPGCPGFTLDIRNAQLIDTANVGPSGNAQITFFVPAGAAGRTILFQAAELGTCRKSQVNSHTF